MTDKQKKALEKARQAKAKAEQESAEAEAARKEAQKEEAEAREAAEAAAAAQAHADSLQGDDPARENGDQNTTPAPKEPKKPKGKKGDDEGEDDDGDVNAKSKTCYELAFNKDVHFAGGLQPANSIVRTTDWDAAQRGMGASSCLFCRKVTKVGKRKDIVVLFRARGATLPE